MSLSAPGGRYASLDQDLAAMSLLLRCYPVGAENLLPGLHTERMHFYWMRSCTRGSNKTRGIISSIFWINSNFRSFFAFSGTSSRSFSFFLGKMTVWIPARRAASTFSLIPPTGSTVPRSVISPVMAISLRIGRRVKSEVKAVNMVTPAEGPSFGTDPAGT